ncbi:MAG: F0F1 ATP synthase subunit C [Nannocystaceae bacterium]|nr:F0F1 ATP synthase subunit C [Myxococcales bacterium]
MNALSVVVAISVFTAGITIAIGGYGPSRGEGEALARALDAIARQPDEADRISRTLFVGMAMVESTAIYALVISLILLFANPLLELVR